MVGELLVLCGMPGAGKGVFSEVAEARGVPVLALGDMVREEVVARGLAGTPENIAAAAIDMRRDEGEGAVVDRLWPRIEAALESNLIVVIDGMRTAAELVRLTQLSEAPPTTLGIDAPAARRDARQADRQRGEDASVSGRAAREARERAWGLQELIAEADLNMVNDSDIDAFRASCEVLLEQRIDLR